MCIGWDLRNSDTKRNSRGNRTLAKGTTGGAKRPRKVVDVGLDCHGATEAFGVWRWDELTPRQKQLALAVVCKPAIKMKRIGDEFGMKYRTVSFYMERIYGVLGVNGRIELAFEMGRNWSTISKEQRGRSQGINKQNPV
jgi:DNA-binding CsgD family transcriptional regulator